MSGVVIIQKGAQFFIFIQAIKGRFILFNILNLNIGILQGKISILGHNDRSLKNL